MGPIITSNQQIALHSRTIEEVAADLRELLYFLKLQKESTERRAEQSFIDTIHHILGELGKKFSFIGRNYRFNISGNDHYIDLLLYHNTSRAFVVILLNPGAFDPGDLGALNFRLAVIDDILRSQHDNKTIGILLCKSKSDVIVEMTLNGFSSLMCVASYDANIPNISIQKSISIPKYTK